MKVLWQKERALPLNEIRKELEAKKDWKASTIKTFLRRLFKKEIIAEEKRECLYYKPLVTEDDYKKHKTERLINRLYDGEPKNLLGFLISAEKISKTDLDDFFYLLENKKK